MPDESSARRELRKELLRVRFRAGLSSRGIAAAIEVNRGVVWRFDNGKGPLPDGAVTRWLDVCGVTGDERAAILDLEQRVIHQARPWSDLLSDREHLQGTAADREAASTLVRGFNPTIWPGLLQTPEYAHVVLSHGRTRNVPAAVERRMVRQTVLYDGGEFRFLIGERPLRADLGRPDILAAQLDRIRSLARRKEVTVRVVPDSVAALPWHNFYLWTTEGGSTYATTELVHGEQEIVAADDLAVYEDLWTRLDAGSEELPASR